MEQIYTLPKIKIDIWQHVDRINSEQPNLKDHEVRALIFHEFQLAARRAGWDFRSQIWPALCRALQETRDQPDKLLEALSNYCTA